MKKFPYLNVILVITAFFLEALSSFYISQKSMAQTTQLSGKFDGKTTQTATIRSAGDNAIAIDVAGQQWYFSPRGSFNLAKTMNRFAVGDVNGDGKSDIVAMYDYGDFNVGFIAFISDGRNFKSELWYSSGKGNINPNAFAGNIRLIDNNKDGKDDVLVPYNYPNNIRGDLVFYSTGNKFYR